MFIVEIFEKQQGEKHISYITTGNLGVYFLFPLIFLPLGHDCSAHVFLGFFFPTYGFPCH